jgi:hypothetical protein
MRLATVPVMAAALSEARNTAVSATTASVGSLLSRAMFSKNPRNSSSFIAGKSAAFIVSAISSAIRVFSADNSTIWDRVRTLGTFVFRYNCSNSASCSSDKVRTSSFFTAPFYPEELPCLYVSSPPGRVDPVNGNQMSLGLGYNPLTGVGVCERECMKPSVWTSIQFSRLPRL